MESRKAEEVADILRSALQRLEGNNRNRNIAGSSSNRNETTERRELEASTSSRPNSSTYALSPTTYASTGAPSPSSTFAPSSSHAPDATRFGLFTSRTQISHSAAIARDFRNAFPSMGGGGRRFNPPAKKQRKNNSFNPHKETCTRDFCLLAKTSESHVPAFNRVNDLQLAGLGKKRITFESKTMDHAGVRNKLEMVYPKLKSQGGAFEFLKATASTSLSKHHVPLNAATEALHDLIEELDKAKTEEEIQSLLFENENKDVFWVLIGSCHWPASASINSINKNLLIQDLIYNEVVSSRREEIGEIGKGLDALGFLNYAKKHAAFIKEILCYNEFLRREFSVDDLKAVCDVAPESDREQQALDWLYSYLSQPHLTDDLPCGTRMKTLLQFWSGNKYPLAAGLSKKFQIRFLADGIGAQKLPTATACLSILRLPTVHNTEDEFSSAMTTALKFEAFGFPNP